MVVYLIMELTEKMILLGVGMLVIIVFAVIIFNRNDKQRQLKEEYETALKGNDREKARAAGRAYYQFTKGNDLTIEDERIIIKETAHLPEADAGGDLQQEEHP